MDTNPWTVASAAGVGAAPQRRMVAPVRTPSPRSARALLSGGVGAADDDDDVSCDDAPPLSMQRQLPLSPSQRQREQRRVPPSPVPIAFDERGVGGARSPPLRLGGMSERETTALQQRLDAVRAAHEREAASLAELSQLAFGAGVCDGALDLLAIDERDGAGGEMQLIRRAAEDARLLAARDAALTRCEEDLRTMMGEIAARDRVIDELERMAIDAETALAEGAVKWARKAHAKDAALAAKEIECRGLREEVERLSSLHLERLHNVRGVKGKRS